MKEIVIDSEKHGLVFIMAITLCLQVTMMGFFAGGKGRKEYMDLKTIHMFRDDHKKAYGNDEKINPQGYPDTGNGRFCKLLPYENWFLFNVMQRRHYNSLEMLIPLLPIIMAAGLANPDI